MNEFLDEIRKRRLKKEIQEGFAAQDQEDVMWAEDGMDEYLLIVDRDE